MAERCPICGYVVCSHAPVIAAQLSQAVEAAQGAILEEAAQAGCLYCRHGYGMSRVPVSDGDGKLWHHDLVNGKAVMPCLAQAIRAIQTEPMTAALAARDQRIRTEAYGHCIRIMRQRSQKATIADGFWKDEFIYAVGDIEEWAKKETK